MSKWQWCFKLVQLKGICKANSIMVWFSTVSFKDNLLLCQTVLYFPPVEMWGSNTDSLSYITEYTYEGRAPLDPKKDLFAMKSVCLLLKAQRSLFPVGWERKLNAVLLSTEVQIYFRVSKLWGFVNDINHFLMGNTGISLNFVVVTESIILRRVCWANTPQQQH